MKGARGGVIAKLRTLQPKIVDVNCICHLVNLCIKSAVKILPLQEFAMFCCVEYKCILKHCETRWLSLQANVMRGASANQGLPTTGRGQTAQREIDP